MYPLAHIHASPFFAYITVERATAESSRFTPPSRTHLDVGKDFSLDVPALDRYGNRALSGNERFLGIISYPKDSNFAASWERLVKREAQNIVKILPHVSHNYYAQVEGEAAPYTFGFRKALILVFATRPACPATVFVYSPVVAGHAAPPRRNKECSVSVQLCHPGGQAHRWEVQGGSARWLLKMASAH